MIIISIPGRYQCLIIKYSCAKQALWTQKIIGELTKPINTDKHDIQIGASIGITNFPDHGDSYETLLHNADMAMYVAKRSGQNNFCYFETK